VTERPHEHLCTGGLCFEDDFTEDCTCWCHVQTALRFLDEHGRPGVVSLLTGVPVDQLPQYGGMPEEGDDV
jgi:hypothetical protein